MPFADLVGLNVVAVGSSFPVEVGPGCSPSASANRGGATGLEAVGAVVDAYVSVREMVEVERRDRERGSRGGLGFGEDGRKEKEKHRLNLSASTLFIQFIFITEAVCARLLRNVNLVSGFVNSMPSSFSDLDFNS